MDPDIRKRMIAMGHVIVGHLDNHGDDYDLSSSSSIQALAIDLTFKLRDAGFVDGGKP